MDPIYESYINEAKKEGYNSPEYKKYRKYLIGLCKKHKIKYSSTNDNYDLILKLEDAGIEIE